MKVLAIIAAVAAVTASATAHAQSSSYGGQSATAAKSCWIADDRGYGRWQGCDSNWMASATPPNRQTFTIPTIVDRGRSGEGGGDSGGGGGGGGGGNGR